MQTLLTESKSIIVEKIIKDAPDKVEHQGTAFQEEEFYLKIGFSDVMDIVLCCLAMDPEFAIPAEITSTNFYSILEKVFRDWLKLYEEDPWFRNLWGAWAPGAGPGGGYASPAEMYSHYYSRFCYFETMGSFFELPEGYEGWRSYYPNCIAKMVLPKWKRKANQKHLPEVFRLAEMLCAEVRKDAAR
jgi:hypothetical protein